jgi:hypothetical protein
MDGIVMRVIYSIPYEYEYRTVKFGNYKLRNKKKISLKLEAALLEFISTG